jgi:hypothetical protein
LTRLPHAARSLASFRVGRRTFYVLPFRSLGYAAISLAIVIAAMLIVDRYVLGSLERAGWTAGELWARHNKLIEENHNRKTNCQPCELRHWVGQPLPANESGRRKILILGDSFIWGPPYITLNHLWWRQLAVELERRGYRDVDVLAAGYPGWSTHKQLECASKLIPEVQPDLIIWGYVTNDPDEKIVSQISDLQDRPPYGERIRRQLKRLLPNLIFKFESLRADKLAAQYAGPRYGYAYPDWELKLLEGENFERYRETVQNVGQFIRDARIPAFVQTLPHFPGHEYFEPRYVPVLKQWQAAGITVNNTLDTFISRYGSVSAVGPESLRWGINPGDSHPGPRITHFHAVMAADFIEQHWPEVLGTKDLSRPHELAINDWLPYDMVVQPRNEQTVDVLYPAKTDLMPRLPLAEPTVLVALGYPLSIDEIRFAGEGLESARVWISMLNPEDHYDENRWRELGKFAGPYFACKLPQDVAGRELAEIRFSAEISHKLDRVKITFVRPKQGEERP